MYLITGKVDGHIKERNGNKYLVFDSTDENKVLHKYTELWDGSKNDIETINGGECNLVRKGKYDKYFMKVNFSMDGNLPLNKILKFHQLTIIVRCISEEEGKFYPQLYLDGCFVYMSYVSKKH